MSLKSKDLWKWDIHSIVKKTRFTVESKLSTSEWEETGECTIETVTIQLLYKLTGKSNLMKSLGSFREFVGSAYDFSTLQILSLWKLIISNYSYQISLYCMECIIDWSTFFMFMELGNHFLSLVFPADK